MIGRFSEILSVHKFDRVQTVEVRRSDSAEVKGCPQAVFNRFKDCGRQHANALRELSAVQGRDLMTYGKACPGKTCDASRNFNYGESALALRPGRGHGDDDRRPPRGGLIEPIVRHNNYGATTDCSDPDRGTRSAQ